MDARRRAMLAELGLHLPPTPHAPATVDAEPGPPAPAAAAAEGSGPRPASQPAPRAPGAPPPTPPGVPSPATDTPPEAGARPGPGPRPAAAPAGTDPDRAHPPAAAPGGAAAAPLAARPTGPVATLDWPALADTVAACRACGLCAQRRQAVLDAGPRDAELMLVGEAPGEQEDREGLPFVGKSGQLLNRMLAAIGVARTAAGRAGRLDGAPEGVYIANALKCRPPGNRNPGPEELAACAPYLQRQVALVRPRLLLLMGRFAVQSLLGTDAPIGRLRGHLHDTAVGVPALVSYHPSYLLRSPMEKAKAWEDLCRVRATLDRLRAEG